MILFVSASSSAEEIDFERDVRPILSDNCYKCHGPDTSARSSELRFDSREGAFVELDGTKAIVPGDVAASELITRIESNDPDTIMPPSDSGRTLSAKQIDLLKRWVADGAKWPESTHWSYIRPQRPKLPQLDNDPTYRDSSNGIDPFVQHRLQVEGMSSSPPANPSTLLRRVTLALTGLPPTTDEMDTFENDDAPDAYDRVVDRLLASPRYGEHMAGPWLDAARYADTDGYQNDRIRYMWRWRDWVVHALNANMPFDQFTIEQLAGDMLPDATLMQQIASGFNRNHRINSEGGAIAAEFHVENVVDRADTTATVWLGLTAGCARCHDHKYDAISQREYYQFYAWFNNIDEWGMGPNNGNSPPYIKVPEEWPHVGKTAALKPLPYEILTQQTSVLRPTPGEPETAMVMHELDKAKRRPTYLLNRGQYDQPDKSAELSPGIPATLGNYPNDMPQNRLGLANWLVSRSNPLTARVITNRYWQMFFGIGLVATSENFGVQGERPTHPQLLDWLATEFMDTEWDAKRMHRTILTSSTWKQNSKVDDDIEQRDPNNRLLSHGPRRRLSGQAIRDQALALSGLLVEEIGGESVKPYMPPGIWKSISNNKYTQDKGSKLFRRSLYTYWRRTVPPPTMLTFNSADREMCTVRKDAVTTPLQALTLMNNVTFVEASRKLAERIMAEYHPERQDRIQSAFRTVTGRRPTDAESRMMSRALAHFVKTFRADRKAAAELLKVGESNRSREQSVGALAAWTMLCSTILNLDEAITID